MGTLVAGGALAVVWFAGTLAFVVRMITWSFKVKPAPDAASAGVWSVHGLTQLTAEALTLPFRQPLTLLPFLIAVAIQQLLQRGFDLNVPVPATDDPSAVDLRAMWKQLILSFALNYPVFLFGGEVTSELVAQHELGRRMSLRRSILRAASRMPASLLATTLQLIGMAAGFIFLIIPGLILIVRWIFVSHAVLLARDNAIRAFRTSLQVTAGHGWRIVALFVLIGLWSFVLRRVLQPIPTVGPLVMSWLDFAWITVALTLLYIRAGGPIPDRMAAEPTAIQATQSPPILRPG
jgi:hypothetical protein